MSDAPISLKRTEPEQPALVAFRGPDAVRYLNGQVTQDVRRATADTALPACVTDAKGKLQFRVWIHGIGGALYVAGDPERADALYARLARYLISDDAEADDLTGSWTRIHVTGGLPGRLPDGVLAISADRHGLPGHDLWIPAAVDFSELLAIESWNPEELETRRIEAGIPREGSELTEGMLPPEAGLDRTDISYTKGCYIGQEVISRIKSAGKVNRRLVRLTVGAGVSVGAGMKLLGADGAEAGTVTSVAPRVAGADRALLGYLKRSADASVLTLESGAEVRLLA